MNTNILRQIRDIQVQGDRLISNTDSFSEIEDFIQYSEEIKSVLLEQVKDDFTLKHVASIPNFDSIETTGTNVLVATLGIFAGGIGAYFREKQKVNNGLALVREIKDKYSSLEFLLKNNY